MSQPTWWRGGRGLPSLIALLYIVLLIQTFFIFYIMLEIAVCVALYLCSDRAPGIVYFGYWLGTVGTYYILYTKQFVDSGSGLLRPSRALPWVNATLLVAASSGDTRQSGSWICVLEEDGRVLCLLDKEVLFIIVRYIFRSLCNSVIYLLGSAPRGEMNFSYA